MNPCLHTFLFLGIGTIVHLVFPLVFLLAIGIWTITSSVGFLCDPLSVPNLFAGRGGSVFTRHQLPDCLSVMISRCLIVKQKSVSSQTEKYSEWKDCE